MWDLNQTMNMILTFKQENSQATVTVVGVYVGSTLDLHLGDDANINRGSSTMISEYLRFARSSDELELLISNVESLESDRKKV